MDDSVATNTATFRGTYNLVSDLGLLPSATYEQIAYALGGEIATVDNNGLVTGVGEGTCTITATAKDGSGVKATCSCEVHNVMVSGITLSESSITLMLYEVSQNPVTAEVSPNNATNKHIEWSGNSAALSIDQNGEDYVLEGLATGQFELIASATDGSGITATCTVNIYQP